MFELLRWSEGYFRFEEGALVPRGGRGAGPVPDRGAADGGGAADRRVVAHRLQGVAPAAGPAAAARRRRQGSEPLDLVPFEWEVLAAVDGARDLHSLAEVLGRSEFEVARTVYGLTNAGIVVLDDPAHPGEEAEPGRDLAALLVPAREALAQGQYDLAAGALEECCGAIRSCPRRAGCSGVCYAALGRLRRGARAVGRVEPARAPHAGRRGGERRAWSGCARRWRRS